MMCNFFTQQKFTSLHYVSQQAAQVSAEQVTGEFLKEKNNKAEHAVQSYAAGVGGLRAWGYGPFLQNVDHMTELHCPYWRKRWGKKNQLTTNLR